MNIEEIISILSEYEIIRPNKIIGDYYSCYCPIHSDGKEKKPSFGILLHDIVKHGAVYRAGWCHCFTCGLSMSLSELVERIFSIRQTPREIRELVRAECFPAQDQPDNLLIPSIDMQIFNAKWASNYIHSSNSSTSVSKVSEAELAKYRFVVPYMYDRKLTDELIVQYDIGVDLDFIPYKGAKRVPCITFPVKNMSGDVEFIARRSIEGKRFYLPKDVEKPVYGIYELPKGVTSVCVTESIFNALTCVKYGYPAIALLGTGTPYQIEILKKLGIREYVLCLDGDEAGERGTNRLKRGLCNTSIVWSVKMPPDKDVNDCSYEEFKILYDKRV